MPYRRLLILLLFGAWTSVSAQPLDSLAIAPERLWFTSQGIPVYIPYVTSEAFEGLQLPGVTRAMIVMHQVGRDAMDTYQIVSQVVQASHATDYTLLVCPQLLSPGQVEINPWLDHGVLVWRGDWFYNGFSANPNLPPARSYAAVDSVVDAIVAACPNLEVIVFSGHAGGAKFVHRYAMVSTIAERHPEIEMLYQFGNSGGYAYLTRERFDPDLHEFITPAEGLDTTGCGNYDNWPFGMSNLQQAQQFRARYFNRNVVLMVGMGDTGLRNPDCQMLLQTPDGSRLQMADLYWAHTRHIYGETPPTHLYFPLSGVPHSIEQFYQDLTVRHILLNFLQDNKLFTTPTESPVIIPAAGGEFSFRISVFNSTFDTLEITLWTELILPDQSVLGPLQQQGLILNPGAALKIPGVIMETISADAPAGNYQHVTKMGVYPDEVYAGDSFEFVKEAGISDPVEPGHDSAWPDSHKARTAWLLAGAGSVPASYSLLPVYPNPFNAMTTVTVGLPQACELTVTVFDVLGRGVADLASGSYSAGLHRFSFDASGLTSGLYFVRATVPWRLDAVRKVMLVR